MQALERRYTDVKQMIQAQETALMTQAERHLSRMEEEITLLRMKHNDLERLSHSEDHVHFLQVWVFYILAENMVAAVHFVSYTRDIIKYPLFWPQSWQSLSAPSGYEDLSKVTPSPLHSFDKVKKTISELKVKVEDVSKEEMHKISSAGW